MSNQLTTKSLFARDDIKKKFEELLGKRAPQFITSVLQIAASNDLLAQADPMSIYNSAAMAATLNLPLNNSLGFAYIVPYKQKYQDPNDGQWKQKVVAQFQIGYKGFKQLALRSGQFLTMNTSDVREGEIEFHDRLSGEMKFKWIQDEGERLKKNIVGYVSFFELLNGYKQTFYMASEKIKQHGERYSKSFGNKNGLWQTDFESMCSKTVTKLNLSKNAPLSIEMEKALITDQAVINDHETEDVHYIDNDEKIIKIDVDKMVERITLMIQDATTLAELETLKDKITEDNELEYSLKLEQLTANEKNKK